MAPLLGVRLGKSADTIVQLRKIHNTASDNAYGYDYLLMQNYVSVFFRIDGDSFYSEVVL